MITRRLLKVQIVMLAGLATIFVLPHAMKSSPAGIAVELPRYVDDWIGHDQPITKRELEVLAKDTQFARKVYSDIAGNQVLVSIVMSGDDMTNSIHRPERCLPAQGWNVVASQKRVLPLSDGKTLEVTKLRNTWAGNEKTSSGAIPTNLTYYWFVGYKDITASHLMRTGIDLRDRILHGYSQRWAYVTITANVAGAFTSQPRTEEQTSAFLERFIQELGPNLKTPQGSPLL